MKSRDQILLEQAYQKIAESKFRMTPQQEHVYDSLRQTGWEFDDEQGDGSFTMKRWDRRPDGSQRLATFVIKPDGDHYRLPFHK
jgi:hypothetical protein